MITKPLLILAFNRPTHVKRLIDSLRPHAPQKILVSVDGPRKGNMSDPQKISQVLEEIKKIDWTQDIELRIREKNLGLRFAVADAVTWVIDKYGEVIVVEDDVEVGPEFLSFMSEMLGEFRNDYRVGHVSGYNLVPQEILISPDRRARFSQIPESYAWATWKRAWSLYDSNLAKAPKLRELKHSLGNWFSALVWKVNFYDAKKENISTWAYRWIAALWKNNLICISPNRNLVRYGGQTDGTHTLFPSQIKELDIRSVGQLETEFFVGDEKYYEDFWIQRHVFKASLAGLILRVLASLALSVRRKIRKFLRLLA